MPAQQHPFHLQMLVLLHPHTLLLMLLLLMLYLTRLLFLQAAASRWLRHLLASSAGEA